MGNTDQPNSILKSYFVNDLSISYLLKPNKIFESISVNLLINNLLNKEYSPHTSRIRGVAGGVPNPGRSFNINLKYEF